ncbi:MAG: hypothetical protein GY822_02160 [Deltaproteobacteria bacterium]|nr:hypothetical protein [Deltaproteobacteria bacterium]
MARCCFGCVTGINIYDDADYEKGIKELKPKFELKAAGTKIVDEASVRFSLYLNFGHV